MVDRRGRSSREDVLAEVSQRVHSTVRAVIGWNWAGYKSHTEWESRTTHGDPMETRTSLQISSASLTSLLETLGVLPFYLRMYATETYNMSHHVQYENNKPVAIGIRLSPSYFSTLDLARPSLFVRLTMSHVLYKRFSCACPEPRSLSISHFAFV